MKFAQIKNNKIENVIILKDYSIADLFRVDPITNEPFDMLLRIDTLTPVPGRDWTFDGSSFTQPPELLPNDDE